LSWFQSLFFTALVSIAMTGIAVWRVSHFFDHTGMHATRRQLSKLGLFDEQSEDDDAPTPKAQHASMAARDREASSP